jgi:putative transposon-encoded protein
VVLHKNMARKVNAIAGGKIKIEDNVEEMFEKTVTPYGNGAKIDSQKKFIGKKAIVFILKD